MQAKLPFLAPHLPGRDMSHEMALGTTAQVTVTRVCDLDDMQEELEMDVDMQHEGLANRSFDGHRGPSRTIPACPVPWHLFPDVLRSDYKATLTDAYSQVPPCLGRYWSAEDGGDAGLER